MADADNERSLGTESLPYLDIVQDVLGTPLMPLHVAYEVADDSAQPPDIRVTVHNLVVDALQQTLRRPIGEVAGVQLSESDRRRTRDDHSDLVLQAGRQIIIANNVAESLARPAFMPAAADAQHTPRSLLQSVMGGVLYDFVQRPHPLKVPGLAEGPLSALQSGLLLVSATATGKTVPLAELAARAKVGEPFSKEDPETNRLLVVVPSMDLLDEYLDPDGTLRQWLPGLTVGEYSHRKRELGADLDFVLNNSVPKAIRTKALRLARYPIRAIDEGHHARAPKLLGELGGLAAGRLVLCTATPREMKRVFVDFTASTPRSAAEQGITRPVRLMTYRYGPEQGGAEKLMARVAGKLIEAGKQVAIYCRTVPNKPGAHEAKGVAQLINAMDLQLPDGTEWEGGDYVRVIAGVSGADENRQAKADYKAGKIRGYVVVGMLKEGTTMPMDALIVHPGYSQDELDQIAGRLPRPILGSANPYEDGLLIEVQPREVPRSKLPLASVWPTYGFGAGDTIDQGTRIGPEYDDDIEDDDFVARSASPSAAGPRPATTPHASSSGRTPNSESVWIDDFLASSDLSEFLAASDTLLREIVIAPEDWGRYERPAEGAKRLAELAAEYNVPEVWLQRRLDALIDREDLVSAVTGDLLTVSYVGTRAASEEDARGEYERWYSTGAVTYLEENPPTPLADGEVMDVADIAEMCDVSGWYIDDLIKRLDLPHEIRLGKIHRPVRHYKMPEIMQIAEEVAKTPVAEPTDEAVPDLCHEMETYYVENRLTGKRHNIDVGMRRRHPDHGVRGFARHVSAEGAANIRDGFYNAKYATPASVSIADMARLAGVNFDSMSKHIDRIPDDERPEIELLKLGPKGRVVSHMERSSGLMIVEAMRQLPLPPDRVTLKMIEAYLLIGEAGIRERVAALAEQGHLSREEAQPLPMNINRPGRGISTWPWPVVQALQEKAGVQVRDGLEPIDYSMVARGPYDPSWQYSQYVQAQLIEPDKLAKLPSRSQLHRIGGRHKLAPGSIPLETYTISRGVRKDDVLQAVATGVIPVAELFYDEGDTPHDPVYIIDSSDIVRFDGHFRPASPPTSEEPAPAAEVVTGPILLAVQDIPPVAVVPDEPTAETIDDTPPAPAAPPVHAAASEAADPVDTPATTIQEWQPAVEVLTTLRCSRVALSHLIAATPGGMDRIRQGEDGTFIASGLAASFANNLKRVRAVDDGWMRHGRLAEVMGVEESQLMAFMRSHDVRIAQGEARVARLYGNGLDYDVSYAPHVWQRLVRAVKAEAARPPSRQPGRPKVEDTF